MLGPSLTGFNAGTYHTPKGRAWEVLFSPNGRRGSGLVLNIPGTASLPWTPKSYACGHRGRAEQRRGPWESQREREREPQRLQNLDWRWWRHEILDRYTDEVCLQDDASIPYMDACDGEFHLKQTCWTRNSRSWESPNGPMAGWEFPHVGTLSVITHQMHKWPITNNPCMVCVSDIDPQNIFKPPLLQDMTIIPYMAWL